MTNSKYLIRKSFTTSITTSLYLKKTQPLKVTTFWMEVQKWDDIMKMKKIYWDAEFE